MLLWQGDLGWIVLSFLFALVGVFGLGIALEGYLFGRCNVLERVLFAAGGLLCVYAEIVSDFAGVFLIALLIYLHRRRHRKAAAAPA